MIMNQIIYQMIRAPIKELYLPTVLRVIVESVRKIKENCEIFLNINLFIHFSATIDQFFYVMWFFVNSLWRVAENQTHWGLQHRKSRKPKLRPICANPEKCVNPTQETVLNSKGRKPKLRTICAYRH
jgi:hypothetical protein